MSKGSGYSLSVRNFYKKAKIPLELMLPSSRTGFTKEINVSTAEQNSSSVKVWGKNEINTHRRNSPKQRREFVRKKIQGTACFILTEGLCYPDEVKRRAKTKRIALFRTPLSKKKVRARLKVIFSSHGLKQMTLSGGLLRVFGVGVLIIGDSGIGKSESILELITRGHAFVSDDVVQIKKTPAGHLTGNAVSLSRNFLEIRGLGIINIKKIFGAKSACRKTSIDLVISLKKWEKGKEYDRLGLKFPETHEILGKKIPRISIPVAPGRNISTLIEVACKVFLLKEKGYHAAEEISEKLDRVLAAG